MNLNGIWLARLSDPVGLNETIRPVAYRTNFTDSFEKLLALSGAHNVRPALVRNLRKQLQQAPQHLISAPHDQLEKIASLIMSRAEETRLLEFARTALLFDTAAEIMAEVAKQDLPAVIVKGPDFADAAYGGIEWRNFSDVDILVAPEAHEALCAILIANDFQAVEPRTKRLNYGERAFLRKSFGGNLLVEVHTDLVHAPELRAAQTLNYALYAGPEYGGVTPAARLVLAGLHGATSHLFGRLQYVVDGLMIARTNVDGDELRERAKQTGATLAVATMLRLAHEIYGSPEAANLLEKLGAFKWSGFERWLIPRSVVLSAKDDDRWRRLPQRYLYRRLLRQHSGS